MEQEDIFIPKPNKDNHIRFLPSSSGGAPEFHFAKLHIIRKKNKVSFYTCPNYADRMMPCPICKVMDALSRNRDFRNRKLAYKIRAVNTYVGKILDRSDNKVKTALVPEDMFYIFKDDTKFVACKDLDGGFDFIWKETYNQGMLSYWDSYFMPNQSSVFGVGSYISDCSTLTKAEHQDKLRWVANHEIYEE